MPQAIPSTAVLYSFRRCPYAIRARLALWVAGFTPGVDLELREVQLGARPPELLEASAPGTVPVLCIGDPPQTDGHAGVRVLSESLEIMLWALKQRDPQGWWQGRSAAEIRCIEALIAQNDGPFKHHLDRWRYPERPWPDGPAPGSSPPAVSLAAAGDRSGPAARRSSALSAVEHRGEALQILRQWSGQLAAGGWLLGDRPSLADMALLPFVRQFRHTDVTAFEAEADLAPLQQWLARFLASPPLAIVMEEPWGPRRPWRSPRWLYHLALSEEWRQARAAGEYRRSSRGLSLAEVGFIHACAAHQIEATAQRFYADAPEMTLLCIDPQRLAEAGVEVRWEAPAGPEAVDPGALQAVDPGALQAVHSGAPQAAERFPHLYGPLPLQAVVRSEPWRR